MHSARFTTLDFDPCPGDPDEVVALARKWRDLAILLTEAALRLDRTDASQDRWQGAAAEAFRTKLNGHRATIGKVRASCEDNARLLGDWAARLRTFQDEARKLDATATRLDERRRQAIAATGAAARAVGILAGTALDPAPPTSDPHAQHGVDQLSSQLNGVFDQAQQLNERYLEAARQHAQQVAALAELPTGTAGWYGTATDTQQLTALRSYDPGVRAVSPEYDKKVKDALAYFDQHIGDSGGLLWSDPAQGAKEVLARLRGLDPAELSAFVLSLSPSQLAQLNGQLGEGSSWWGGGSSDAGVRLAWGNLLFGSANAAALARIQKSVPNLQPPLAGDNDGSSYVPWPGRLFAPGGPDIKKDLSQGSCGDCYFLSSVAAIAEREPGFFPQHIHENPNGTYTVTFYQDGHPVPVTVDNQLPINDNLTTEYAKTNSDVVWVAIYEKAYAQYRGGYDVIDQGGNGDTGLHDLTGQPTHRESPGDMSLSELAKKVDSGYAVTSGTKSDASIWPWVKDPDYMDGSKLVTSHEYSVEHVDLNAHPPTVTLLNPWGRYTDPNTHRPIPQEVTLTQDQWHQYCDEVSFTRTRV